MLLNNKKYNFEIRTEEENKEFLELLEIAEDKLNQALGGITYSSLKNINTDIARRIKDIIGNISMIEYEVSSKYEPIYKPVIEE